MGVALAALPPTEVVAVYPTQLFEVALGLAMFAILWRLRDHKHATGWLFGVYCVLAGIERFIVEFFRAVPVLIMMIFAFPLASLRRFTASMPSLSGMTMSMVTRSGRNSRYFSMALAHRSAVCLWYSFSSWLVMTAPVRGFWRRFRSLARLSRMWRAVKTFAQVSFTSGDARRNRIATSAGAVFRR